MKIKSIKKLKNKYKIVLEEGTTIITYDEVILKNNILYKKELDETLINQIEEQNKKYEIYNNILKLFKTRLRSEYEIKQYLNKQDISETEQEKIIKKLKESKLINDEIFAHAYIHDKISFTNDGPNKIKQELLKNKIDENIIENELESLDKNELLEKLKKMIIKKINVNTKYSNTLLKNKLLNHFTNLGYEKNDILYIIDNNTIKNENIIKKEYEKLYKKLTKKYSGEELKRNIKQKLYQKGFSIDEINKII